jgi:hypothetical protein
MLLRSLCSLLHSEDMGKGSRAESKGLGASVGSVKDSQLWPTAGLNVLFEDHRESLNDYQIHQILPTTLFMV